MCLSLNLFSQYRSTSDVLPTHPSPSSTTLNEYVFPPAAAAMLTQQQSLRSEPLPDHSGHRAARVNKMRGKNGRNAFPSNFTRGFLCLKPNSLPINLCDQSNGVSLCYVTGQRSCDLRRMLLADQCLMSDKL